MNTVNINGKEKELEWVEKQGHWDAHYEVDGIPFNGHRILWSFSYEPYTYLKESELSGEEWRKGGTIHYFRNGEQVFEEFCREPDYASRRILTTLPKLMEFDWNKLVKGTKIYWRETPALIDYVMLDQGAFTVVVDGADRFPDHVWAKEDWEKLEDPTRVKIDIFDPHIWWWRD
ncbi:MAG: hypothetical protein AB1757_06680 [Acidobacteriota bacterium]